MRSAATQRARDDHIADWCHVALARMDNIPVRNDTRDFVVAHGIWSLARSSAEFRWAPGEVARVARPGAGLFVFTCSRNTFPPDTEPVPGECFVFTQFSGQPQCVLTDARLVAELAAVGFRLSPDVAFNEYNRPRPGALRTGPAPVIYDAAFRFDE
jgi:hypothetical protein